MRAGSHECGHQQQDSDAHKKNRAEPLHKDDTSRKDWISSCSRYRIFRVDDAAAGIHQDTHAIDEGLGHVSRATPLGLQPPASRTIV